MKKLFLIIFIGSFLVSCSKSDDDGVEAPATVTNIEPEGRAMVGDTVTIHGENFGRSQSAVTVSFSGTRATIVFFSSTELKVLVPDVQSGDFKVSLMREQIYSSNFEIEKDLSIIVSDEFQTDSGSISGRVPSFNIAGRSWSSITASGTPLVGGRLQVGNEAVASYNISDDEGSGYTKPEEITLSTTFNLGTIATDDRDYRGLFIGFYSATDGITAPTQNFRGLIIDPNGRVSFWNADNTVFGNVDGATEQMDYRGTWDVAADHTLELSVNTVTGDWIAVIIDGEAYNFESTDAFEGSKTDHFGFGMWTAVSAAFAGYIDDVNYGAHQEAE